MLVFFLQLFFFSFSFRILFDFEQIHIDEVKVYVCVSVCVSVCPSVASHISETSEAIAIKFDKLTASVTKMHHISNYGHMSMSCKTLVSACCAFQSHFQLRDEGMMHVIEK